jgi:hypothetical protein
MSLLISQLVVTSLRVGRFGVRNLVGAVCFSLLQKTQVGSDPRNLLFNGYLIPPPPNDEANLFSAEFTNYLS